MEDYSWYIHFTSGLGNKMTLLPTSVPANFSSVAAHGDQNWTNNTGCPRRMEEWTYTVTPVYILLISVLGILFNVFVLVVFCFHKKPCTVTEIYLSNLAVADLVLVSFLPFWAVNVSNSFNWLFGSAMCRLVNLAIIMNMYCSIYFLVLVSTDRYFALVQPQSHKRLRTTKFAKLGCLLVWGLGLLLSVPTIIYRDVKHYPEYNFTICYLNYPNTKAMLLLEGMLPIFTFIIPISFISYCAWKIIQTLKNQLMRRLKSQKMEQKATTLILAVLLAFLICWVPFHLVKIMELLSRTKVLGGCGLNAIIETGKQIFMYLAFFNSVLNPILYVIVGQTFRKKVRELFEPLIIKRTEPSSHNSKPTYFWRSGKTEDVTN